MAYFLMVMSKTGVFRGSSAYRKGAGWFDVMEMARPLSGSGYVYRGTDRLAHRVEVKMAAGGRANLISDVLKHDQTLPAVAIEAVYNDKPTGWFTFFDVTSAGGAGGSDPVSPTGFVSYIFDFDSARTGDGAWPGVVRNKLANTGLDPSRVIEHETKLAILSLPVPDLLRRY